MYWSYVDLFCQVVFVCVFLRRKNVNFTQSARARVSVTTEEYVIDLCKLLFHVVGACCVSQA